MITSVLESPNDVARRLTGRDYLSWTAVSTFALFFSPHVSPRGSESHRGGACDVRLASGTARIGPEQAVRRAA